MLSLTLLPCPGRNEPLRKERLKWKSDYPMTDGQLRSKRDEFWDTAPAFEGRKEIWDALKAAAYAAEANDHELAQAILDGASITLPHGEWAGQGFLPLEQGDHQHCSGWRRASGIRSFYPSWCGDGVCMAIHLFIQTTLTKHDGSGVGTQRKTRHSPCLPNEEVERHQQTSQLCNESKLKTYSGCFGIPEHLRYQPSVGFTMCWALS